MPKTLLSKMKKINYWEIFLCFCVPWWVFYGITIAFFNNAGVVPSGKYLLYNVTLPPVFLFFVGVFINYMHKEIRITFVRTAIPALILFGIDQLIKVFVNRYKGNGEPYPGTDAFIVYDGFSIPLIDDWLLLEPTLHSETLVSFNGWHTATWAALPLMAVVIVLIYRYSLFMKKDKWLTYIAIMFLSTVTLRDIVDQLLYGGVYDYIRLYQYLSTDLGDVYIGIGLCAYFQSYIHNMNKEALKKENSDPFDVSFFKHEYCCIKNAVLKKFKHKS